MTDHILKLMTERKKKKNTVEYHSINKQIQKECRKTKEAWLQRKCEEIETPDRKHQTNKCMTGSKS